MFKCSICKSIFSENHQYEECKTELLDQIETHLNNLNVHQLKKIINYIINNELLSN